MKLTIFYSWQMKTNPKKNKNYIKDCIEKACKKVVNKKKPELMSISFDIQESRSEISGTPQIASVIMDDRIPNCDIFIADLSVTDSYSLLEKCFSFFIKRDVHQANNVMIEYGIAYNAKGTEVIIGVLNSDYGSPKENPENIAFDLRHMSFPIEYKYNIEKEKFIDELVNAISECAITAIRHSKDNFKPFQTWNEFSRRTSNLSLFFENETIISIKQQLLNNKTAMRFLGLSGLGKTRITFEAFRNQDESVSLNYLYCDYQSIYEPSIQTALERIFADKSNKQTIVIDSCPLTFFRKVLRMQYEHNGSNPIITLFNEPEELTIDKLSSVEYIQLSISDLESVVEKMLDELFLDLTGEQKKIIKEFSEGIPLMAVLLAENTKNESHNLGLLSDKELLNKLLSVKDQKEMVILQSCAIFRYIGFEDEVREQIEFIITNSDITPITGDNNEKLNLFEKIFSKYIKREIFEKNGRFLSIRPRPLAFYLAEQWFDSCDTNRLSRVFNSLQDQGNNQGRILIESLSKQIVYLGDNPKVVSLIEKITGFNGPFDNAKVVNTELGSRLFRAFAEVNPAAVSENLYRLFSNMPIKELKNIEEGRQNLVWTLEKLCFDNSTFEKSIKLMMAFAIAENEQCDDNSTRKFIHLFKIFLPGTQASLVDRLKIIKWGIAKKEEYEKLTIKALSCALDVNGFIFFAGAEKQGTKTLEHYHPSNQEIGEYWMSVLGILKTEILTGTPDNSELCTEVLLERSRGLIRGGAAELILPVLDEIISFKNNDWDEMLDLLYSVIDYDLDSANEETKEMVKKYINILTKDDFISRFKEIHQYRQVDEKMLSSEDYLNHERELYKKMAEEFVENETEYASMEILKFLYSCKYFFANPFGFNVADITKCDFEKTKLFINHSIIVLNGMDECNFSMLIDYTAGLNDEGASYLIEKLYQEKKLSFLLFCVLAIRKMSLNNLSLLFSLIDENMADVHNFKNFFAYYRITPELDMEIVGLLKMISKQYGIDGLETSISIIYSLFIRNKNISEYPQTLDFAEKMILEISFADNYKELGNNFFKLIIALLKESERPKLAAYANAEMIKIARDFSFSYNNNQELYSVLLDKYFDIIWEELSTVLLADGDEYIKYYSFKFLLGSHIRSIFSSTGILFKEKNYEKIFAWCDANPVIAPIRIMAMAPVYEGESFHPIVMTLLNKFGNNRDMLDALYENMASFGWVGSITPLLEKRKKALEELLIHENQTIVDWAERQIDYTGKEVEREKQREDEEKYLYG